MVFTKWDGTACTRRDENRTVILYSRGTAQSRVFPVFLMFFHSARACFPAPPPPQKKTRREGRGELPRSTYIQKTTSHKRPRGQPAVTPVFLAKFTLPDLCVKNVSYSRQKPIYFTFLIKNAAGTAENGGGKSGRRRGRTKKRKQNRRENPFFIFSSIFLANPCADCLTGARGRTYNNFLEKKRKKLVFSRSHSRQKEEYSHGNETDHRRQWGR